MKKFPIHVVFLMGLNLIITGGYAQLNGVNTINPSLTNFSGNPGGIGGRNYTSFNNAVNALTTYGVSGAVIFNIASGTYTEQVCITYCSVNPPTPTNTVTFQSASGDSSLVNLTYGSTNASVNYTLQLDGASYIIFKKITFTNTNTIYSRVIDITNGSGNNQFLNNRIIGVATSNTSDQNAVIYSNAVSLFIQYNIFRNNRIMNGSYGIYMNGYLYNTYGNVIESNILREFNYCGVYAGYQYGMMIRYNDLLSSRPNVIYGISCNYLYYTSLVNNNIINIPAAQTTTHGIYIYYCYYSCGFNNNDIDLSGQGSKYGIYCRFLIYSGQIGNNSIDISSSNSSQFGIYLTNIYYNYSTDAAKIISNKINLFGTSPFTNYGIYAYYFYNSSPTYRSRIANNFISQANGSGQTYGIYAYYNQNTDIIFNSISIAGTDASSVGINIFPDPGNPCTIKNNIAACPGGGVAIDINNSAGITGCDYNDYYVTGPYLGRYMGTNITDLASWKNLFSNNDAASISINPLFTSTVDLHTMNLNLQRGIPYSSVTTDIDGQARNTSSPFIGADEYFAPMRFLDVTTLQNNTNFLVKNSPANDIICVSIEMNGSNNPFNAKQFVMTTSGTTALTDIAKARLFYTAGRPVFDTLAQFGSTITTPGTTLTFNGTRTLAPGCNYFWLSVAITSSAINGHYVDAQCTQVTIDSAGYNQGKIPDVTNPAGNRMISTPMFGIYTINPSGSGSRNYMTFNDAVADMMFKNISGPVTFIVSPGIFNERVEIGVIPGASSNNTVTFYGAGTGTTNTTLTFTGLTLSQRATLSLNGAKYVTFRKMKILNNSINNYANAVFFGNQAKYNTVDSCYLSVPLVTGFNAYCNVVQLAQDEGSIYNTYGLASYNTFSNNVMVGGSSAVYLYGNYSNRNYVANNEFIKNTMMQQYYAGVMAYYMNYLKVANNTISSYYGGWNNSYGIYDNQCNYSRFHGNVIQAGYYGIFVYYETGSSAIYTEIFNNMISNFSNIVNHYGIYSQSSNYVKIYHNSIWIQGNYNMGGESAGIYLNNAGNNLIQNNILVTTGNFYAINWYYPGNTPATNTFDNNVYYSATAPIVKWNNAVYADLKTWKAVIPQQNQNSTDFSPGFTSYSDLHINPGSMPLGGPFLNDVNTDIDGEPRGPSYSLLGADEYSLPNSTDADVINLDILPMAVTGNNNITVTLYNKGYKPIPAGNVYLTYQVNSGTVIKDTLKLSSQWIGFTMKTFTFKKPWLISGYTRYHVKTMINPVVTGDPDTFAGKTSKDSFTKFILPALSAGTYYIDSSRVIPGSFPDFTSAVEALRSGITGPVKFIVTKGTYPEQVVLTKIPNASQTNTITFESQTGKQADVTLTYYNASQYSNYTLRFDQASYFIFKNMTISSSGYLTYHRVIEMSGKSIYNSFINNIIKGVYIQNISDDYAVIYSPFNSEISWNSFIGNEILNGSTGFRLYGSQVPGAKGIVIDNNRIIDFYFQGIFAMNLESFTITNNKIINQAGSVNVYGLNLNYLDYYVSVPVNGFPPNGPGQVINNEINMTGNGVINGIFCSYCSYGLQIMQNKITIDGTGLLSRSGIQWRYTSYNGQGMKISKNRIYLLAYGTGSNYGLRTANCNISSTYRHLVSNNFIIQKNGTGTTYGFYHDSSGFIFYYHNNINIKAGSSTNYGIYLNAPANNTAYTINEVRNNIFSVNSLAGGYAIGINSPLLSGYKPVFACDNNDFFVVPSAGNLGTWGMTACTDLADWKATSALDAGSISIDPGYATDLLLYPSDSSLIYSMNPINTVPDDIDGNLRKRPVTIGAANLSGLTDAGISEINYPVSLSCAGTSAVRATLKNFGLTDIDSVRIRWSVNGINQSPVIFRGKLPFGEDTVLTLGSYSFLTGTYKICAYTSLPNGMTDLNPSNDADSVTGLKTLAIPGAPSIYPDTVCENMSAILRASSVAKHYEWYDSVAGGNIIGRDSFYTTPPLGSSRNFYVSAGTGGTPQSLLTSIDPNTHGNGFMFNITAKNYDLRADSFDIMPYNTGTYVIKLYYRPGTYAGYQMTRTAWTLIDSFRLTVTSNKNLVHIPIGKLILKNQTWGFYMTSNNKALELQGKTGLNSFSDSRLTLSGGSSVKYSFDTLGSIPSIFCGKIYYEGYPACMGPRLPVPAYVNPNANLSFSINDSTQCLTGNCFRFANASTSIDSVTGYFWNFGDNGFQYKVYDTSHSYNNPGIYKIRLQATTVKGCLDSISKNVYVYAATPAYAGPDTTIPCNSSVRIGSAGNLAFNYLWTPATGLSNPNVADPIATPLISTVYTLTLTEIFSGCRSTDQVRIVISNAPVANAGKDTTICEGSSAVLKASGGTSYLWNTGETSASIIKKPVSATSYFVLVKSAAGCSDYDTVNVSINPKPVADFSVNDSSQCLAGNSFVFYNRSSIKSGKNTYTWQFGDGKSSLLPDSVNHTYSTFNTFIATLFAISGFGCRDTTSRLVDVYPMPKADFGVNNSIQCLSANSFGFTDKSSIPSGSYITYWSFGDGNSTNAFNPFHYYNKADTYSAMLTVVSNYLCRDSIRKNIIVKPNPIADFEIDDTAQCLLYNEFAFANKSSIKSGSNTYNWYFGDGYTSGSAGKFFHSFISPGKYYVKLVAESDLGCSDSVNKTVHVFPMPVVDLGPDQRVKPNAKVVLDAGPGFKYYLWSTNANGQKILVDSTGIGMHAASFWVMVTDQNGCSATDDIIITFTNDLGIITLLKDEPSFLLYPNPSVGELYFQCKVNKREPVRIEILNSRGSVVFERQITLDNEDFPVKLDLSHLAKGIYLFRLNSPGSDYTERFIIR